MKPGKRKRKAFRKKGGSQVGVESRHRGNIKGPLVERWPRPGPTPTRPTLCDAMSPASRRGYLQSRLSAGRKVGWGGGVAKKSQLRPWIRTSLSERWTPHFMAAITIKSGSLRVSLSLARGVDDRPTGRRGRADCQNRSTTPRRSAGAGAARKRESWVLTRGCWVGGYAPPPSLPTSGQE